MAPCKSTMYLVQIVLATNFALSAAQCPTVSYQALKHFHNAVISPELRELLPIDYFADLKQVEGGICVCDVAAALRSYADALRSVHPDKGGDSAKMRKLFEISCAALRRIPNDFFGDANKLKSAIPKAPSPMLTSSILPPLQILAICTA